MNLSDGNTDADAKSIVVSGNDVHIVGLITHAPPHDNPSSPFTDAIYWKNGVANKLPGGNRSIANDIAIEGADVYITGIGKEIPVDYSYSTMSVWKNGIEYSNQQGMEGNSIAISNGSVYFSGRNFPAPKLNYIGFWKYNSLPGSFASILIGDSYYGNPSGPSIFIHTP